MLNWNFSAENYSKEDLSYELIPEGNYRVRIKDVEETTSKKSGKPMLKFTIEVNSYESSPLNTYIVLDDEKENYTNQQLGRVYDSFRIPEADQNYPERWKGKVGGAVIEHEDYKDKNDKDRTRALIKRFMIREDVDKLPAWKGKTAPAPAHAPINPEMVDMDNDNVPF